MNFICIYNIRILYKKIFKIYHYKNIGCNILAQMYFISIHIYNINLSK